MAIRFTDGIDLAKTSLIAAALHPVTVDPASPVAGQIWMRTDLGRLSYWDGAQVVRLEAASAAATLAALLTVDGVGSGLDADLLGGVASANYALKTYVDTEVAGAIDTLVGGASAAYDTLQELQTALQGNDTDIAAILSAQAGKTDKFAADIGDGSATQIAVTHNLGTKDVTVSVRVNASDEAVIAPWVATSANVVTVSFAVAPTSGEYRVVVVG